MSIPITLATLKLHTKCPKTEKERKNSTKDILVALERKITKGALQEYRGLLFSWFLSKILSWFQSVNDWSHIVSCLIRVCFRFNTIPGGFKSWSKSWPSLLLMRFGLTVSSKYRSNVAWFSFYLHYQRKKGSWGNHNREKDGLCRCRTETRFMKVTWSLGLPCFHICNQIKHIKTPVQPLNNFESDLKQL